MHVPLKRCDPEMYTVGIVVNILVNTMVNILVNMHRYATNAISAALFREVGHRRGVPTQEFCVRSDLACGSTIGTIDCFPALMCPCTDVSLH